jgi:hypothetical protein
VQQAADDNISIRKTLGPHREIMTLGTGSSLGFRIFRLFPGTIA